MSNTDTHEYDAGIIHGERYRWYRGIFDILLLLLGAYILQFYYTGFSIEPVVILCALMWASNLAIVNIKAYSIKASLMYALVILSILACFSILLWMKPVAQLITAWSVIAPWALGSAIVCIAVNRSFHGWEGPVLLSLGGLLVAGLGYAVYYADAKNVTENLLALIQPEQFIVSLFAALFMASRCARPGSLIMLPGLAVLAYIIVLTAPDLNSITSFLFMLGFVSGAKVIAILYYIRVTNPRQISHEELEERKQREQRDQEFKESERKMYREFWEYREDMARATGNQRDLEHAKRQQSMYK